MFETKLAEDIRRKLSSINPNLKEDPYLLVKAYLSHKVKAKLKSFSNQDIGVLKDYLIYDFFSEDPRVLNTTDNIRNVFRSCRTFGQFLNMFAPDLVVDIDAVKSMFPEQETDQISLLLNILVVKKIVQDQDLSIRSIQNGLFELYIKEVEKFPKTIALIQSRDELSKLIHAMYSIDINSVSNSDVFSDESETVRLKLLRIAELFFDNLQWSRSQMLGFCAKHYEFKNNRKLVEDSVDEEIDYLKERITVSDFLPRETALQSTRDLIAKLCNELNNRAINSNPVDLHCALYLFKKQVYDIGHQKSEAKRRLSIDVEDTVAFNLFTEELFDLDDHNILLILPSPFFMRKYGETDFTRNLHTTVVVPDVNYMSMFTGQYANNPDIRKRNHNFEFVTVRHYLESDVQKNDYDRIIYFENHTDSLKEIDFIMLNSPGGSVQAGFMLIDTIQTLKCDVEVIVIGLAASMGAMILMAGTKGKRKALPHARIMLHQPLGGAELMQASDFEITAKEMARTKKELYGFICNSTGKTYSQVAEDCDRNFWMSSQEAVEYGIIDGIVTKENR